MKWRSLLGQQLEDPKGPQENLDGLFFMIDETIESVKMPEIHPWVANAVSLSRHSSSIPESEDSLLIL